jgi:four helix bundle protein
LGREGDAVAKESSRNQNQGAASRERIVERSVALSLRVIRLFREIESDGVGRVLGRQLLRCSTSIGANIHEAQAAQTKADFIAKISIAHKEAIETAYWLRLLRESELISAARISALEDEVHQVTRVVAAILLSAKGRRPTRSSKT